MPDSSAFPDELGRALAGHGLCVRGGWRPDPAADHLPCLPGGGPAGVVWMIGVAGAAYWAHFSASPCFSDGRPDPLDRWSRAIGDGLAKRWGGCALYPFDGPPYWPFQQWADRAEPLQQTPLGLRIHPAYGLWHAYRFALALPGSPSTLPDRVAPVQRTGLGDLCLSCDGQPCLHACPVDAFDGKLYRLEDCLGQLWRPEGGSCMQLGCLARRACPVGVTYRHPAELAAFHMRAFADSHRPAPTVPSSTLGSPPCAPSC